MGISYYELLGVDYNFSSEQIQKRYEEIIKNGLIHHSVSYRDDLFLAYETLKDEEKRKIYDNNLTSEDKDRINSSYSLYNGALDMFLKLDNNIDEQVFVEYIWCGDKKSIKGKLNKFVSFSNLVVGNRSIPFVGKGSGIVRIIKCDTMEELYNNKNIESFFVGKNLANKVRIMAFSWGNFIAYKYYDKFLNRFEEDENSKVKCMKL